MSVPLRVLMVEDFAEDALLELRELKRGGYEPLYERVDTPEALEAALEKQTWDIILSDYVMPSFSGPAALKLVKESGIDIPVVMVTGQVGEETAIETLTAGAHDYVMKDNMARLVPAIQRVLQDATLRRERRQAGEALRKAHEELRLAHAELEHRVEERTAELARANQELRLEIAERTRAEKALRESEEMYRSLFTSMSNGYAFCEMVLDERGEPTDFVYLEVNDAFERLTGLRRKDVVGNRVTEAIPGIKEGNPEIIPTYGEVARTGSPISFEVFFEPLGIWLTISVYSPKQGFFVAVFDNISERKQAEEALRENEQRWATTLKSIGDAVIATDEAGKITFINPVAEELTGWSLDEALHRPVKAVFNIINEHTRMEVEDPVIKVFDRGTVVGLANHTILVRKDGTEIPIEDSGAPIRDDEGRITGAVLVFRDVTGQKRAEKEREDLLKEAQEQRNLLRMVLENAPNGIAVLQGWGLVYQVVNPAYQVFLPGKQILGRTFAEVWPEAAETQVPLLRRVLDTGEPFYASDVPIPIRRSPDGPLEERYWTYSYLQLPPDHTGEPGILSWVTETTDVVRARQRAEQ